MSFPPGLSEGKSRTSSCPNDVCFLRGRVTGLVPSPLSERAKHGGVAYSHHFAHESSLLVGLDLGALTFVVTAWHARGVWGKGQG